jgi:BirA family biotin operon repressor/biotin-[acetyl-CoA-carboxylase] ligase
MRNYNIVILRNLLMRFFKKIKILTFEELNSSNSKAWDRIKSNEAQHGDVILAQFQNSGKGQGSNSWYSSSGKNLLLSIICKDLNLSITKLPVFNMLVSLALHDTLRIFFEARTYIKWPNDILIDDKKIAGILIETTLAGETIKNAVIGIGININESQFPDELSNAASIFTLTKSYQNTETILSILIENIDKRLSHLNYSFEEIQKDYEAVLYGLNLKKYFRSNNHQFEGSIAGVNEIGQLCISTSDGLKTFNHKEVSIDFSKY